MHVMLDFHIVFLKLLFGGFPISLLLYDEIINFEIMFSTMMTMKIIVTW